jgi:hypothetical protein
MAYLTRKTVPEIEAFGAVCLNRTIFDQIALAIKKLGPEVLDK